MIFWDASAVIPLCIDEPHSKAAKGISDEDGAMAAWWGSPVECLSAFARLRRENILTTEEEDQLRQLLARLSETWTEIKPSREVRDLAARVLLLHPLSAADSLQLAAALVWAGKSPMGHKFACLDKRLREAARKEGFTVVPAETE